jgi:hypothetical protein
VLASSGVDIETRRPPGGAGFFVAYSPRMPPTTVLKPQST